MTDGQRRRLNSSLFCIREYLLKQEFFAEIGGEIFEAEGLVKRKALNAFLLLYQRYHDGKHLSRFHPASVLQGIS